jgi:kumamolisin
MFQLPLEFQATVRSTRRNLPGYTNFPPELDGQGQTIGIVELGGGYRDSDLNAYFAGLKLPRPNVTSVAVSGGKNSPSDPNGADSQVALDIEVSGAIAPKARIVIYFAPNTNQAYLQAIDSAVADTINRPSVLLIDWGSAEALWTPDLMRSINQSLAKAAAMGITVVVAAGDNGARENQSDGNPHVDFPASSPWVLAVGGTKLIARGNSIASETVWNDGEAGGATGGGVSEVLPRPDWQSKISIAGRSGGLNGRAIPDVAANASPTTGYQVLVAGRRVAIGGTSASAPLWAGLIALLNQGIGHNLGHFNPILYQKLGPSGILRAITVGNNSMGKVKGYQAGPGWNACTGWGTPDGKELLEALK